MDSCAVHFIEFKDRHQLDSIHPQLFQIRNLFHNAVKCSRILHAGRFVFCEPSHMQFINHQIREGRFLFRIVAPVELTGIHSCMIVTVVA